MAYSASDVAFPHTITVVIQTRDRPRLAARAVQRVFDQDGFDPALLDVVVVDDGSRVDPPDPSRSEANAKVRVIRHHESQGTGPARKSGATAGRGEFIAFLGDHGILLPDKLTTIVRAMNESPPPRRRVAPSLRMGARGSSEAGPLTRVKCPVERMTQYQPQSLCGAAVRRSAHDQVRFDRECQVPGWRVLQDLPVASAGNLFSPCVTGRHSACQPDSGGVE